LEIHWLSREIANNREMKLIYILSTQKKVIAMKKVIRVTASTLATVLAATFISTGATAHDNLAANKKIPKHVLGTYSFSTIQSCARSKAQVPGSVSIDPVTLQFTTPVDVIGMSGTGKMVFRADGTFGLYDAKASEFDQSNLLPGATPVSGGFIPVCEGVYDMLDKNSFTINWHCSIDVPSQGISLEAGPVLVDGFITSNGQSGTMNLLQNVQTLTASVNGNPVAERQRVCLQSFTFIKTGK
jgi:hypothetical protein